MDVRYPAGCALALAAGLAGAPAGAAVILQQDFETQTPDAWRFTATPPAYNTAAGPAVSGNADVWGPVSAFAGHIDRAFEGALFWGVQDITNPSASGPHRLDFAPVDLTGWTDVTLRLAFRAEGFDSRDRLAYRVNAGEQDLFLGATGGAGTDGWQLFELALGAVDRLAFSLIAQQDGGSDFAGFDGLRLSGTRSAAGLRPDDDPPVAGALPAAPPLSWVLPLSALLLWRRRGPRPAAPGGS